MANLGSLVVSLEANIARFTSDMSRAAEQTQQAMSKMNTAINMVKGGLAALGAGISVGAIASLVKETIDAADNLRDMSQKSGVAIETLNGLGFAAGQAGGNLESLVDAASKANKAIVDAAGGNKDTIEAFGKLGISVRDASGHLKTADVVIAEVADKFEGYADGPAKSAIALRIFGDAGAKMIPLLNDGGAAMRENTEYAKKYSGMTTELANGSDNFNDTMGKLAVQQKNFANIMTTAALPVMQAIADELLRSAEGSDKFAGSSGGLRKTLADVAIAGAEVVFTFSAVTRELIAWHEQVNALGVSFGEMAKGPAATVAALVKAVATGDASFSKFTAISDAYKIDAERARKEHDEFLERLKKSGEATAPKKTDSKDPKKPDAPALRAAGDDPTKALMEGRLKTIEAAYARERDTSGFHDKFMAELRAQDLVDVATYEAFKLASLDTAAANAQRAYDAEIAVLLKARASSAKEADRADIDNKIKDVAAKKEQALLDAQQDRAVAILGQSAAQSDLNRSMKEWGIQQDRATEQLEFSNSLYGKSALEVAQLTDARRAELEVLDQIRLAKEKGAISDESIARFQAQAKARSPGVNKQLVVSATNQIKQDQKTPGEFETDFHKDRIATIQAAIDAEYETIAAGNQLLERENQRHEDAMAQARLGGVQMAGDAAGQMYSMLQQAGMEQTALGKALFIANKAIAVAEIIMNTEIAAAKAQAQLGIWGTPAAVAIRVMGYASAGLVAGMAIASAEGGYDIPAGTNPVTQLHEKEMVLPKAQANVIRGLAANGGAGGGNMKLTIVNQTSGHIGNVVEQRISATERALIIQEAVGATAAQLNDPNSKTSRSMSRNYSTPRTR